MGVCAVIPSYTIERIGPLHTIYVGSGNSGALSVDEVQKIVTLCKEKFSSFTCVKGDGHFRGTCEETLIIQVATSDLSLVQMLCCEIALAFNQLGVGLVGPDTDGTYVYSRVVPSGRSALNNGDRKA